MSYHSHSNTPAIVESPTATSPKYSMSGIANEINRSKSQNGLLSTLFGRSKYGTADRTSNAVHDSVRQRDYWLGQDSQLYRKASGVRPGSSITSGLLGAGIKGRPSSTPGVVSRR